jgi:polar amino acid transport system substrate-binding protein
MRFKVTFMLVASGLFLLAACSSASSSPGTSSGTSSAAANLGLQTPGTLHLAADFSVPPNQYIQNGQYQGIDVDLCNAIANVMHVKITWTDLAFDSLISGLEAHRYDALCTGVFITSAREQVMNMVPYVQWGVTMGINKSTSGTYQCTPQNGNYLPCFERFSGKTVSTESGGFEEQLLQNANKQLQSQGKAPMNILGFAQTTQAFQAFTNGTAQGVWVDDPQFYFFNSNNGNKYLAAFGGDDPTPLSLTTTKQNTALAHALASALQTLKSNGTYQRILTKWHVESVPSFTLNPPAS